MIILNAVINTVSYLVLFYNTRGRKKHSFELLSIGKPVLISRCLLIYNKCSMSDISENEAQMKVKIKQKQECVRTHPPVSPVTDTPNANATQKDMRSRTHARITSVPAGGRGSGEKCEATFVRASLGC